MSPFELGFIKENLSPYIATDFVVDCFFAVDIFLTFFVAYVDTKTYLLVNKRSQIAARYSMLVDCFALPCAIMALLIYFMEGIYFCVFLKLSLASQSFWESLLLHSTQCC